MAVGFVGRPLAEPPDGAVELDEEAWEERGALRFSLAGAAEKDLAAAAAAFQSVALSMPWL